MSNKIAHKRDTLYANLMDEVKVRLDCISTTTQGRGNYPTVIVREICYLQLRLLCELIALSCLVAHGDIASLKSNKIGKAYSADEILHRLTELRPHFYPTAIRKEDVGNPPTGYQLHPIVPSPLPELLSLYALTHRYVHRGTLKRMLSMDTPIDMHVDVPKIISWGQKISNLLACHAIPINDGEVLLCTLRNRDDGYRVQVATAKTRDAM